MKNTHQVKKDCFAFNDSASGSQCACLKELYCANEECKFYKTDINGKYEWQFHKKCNNFEEIFKEACMISCNNWIDSLETSSDEIILSKKFNET